MSVCVSVLPVKIYTMALMVKNPPANAGDLRETQLRSWVRKMPWRRAGEPTPVLLPGESPGTEEPGGLQSTGHRESDTTEGTQHAHVCACIYE